MPIVENSLRGAVASLASAGLGSRVLAAQQVSPGGHQQQTGHSCALVSSAAQERSPMTLSFRIGAAQWLTDEQWGRLLELLGAHRPAVDELSLFTNEAMGWFGTMDEMAPDAELMARRIREAHAAGYRSVGINVLCTLGHGDPVGEWSPEFTLPRTMGHDGQQATHCPCPNSVPSANI